MGGKQIDDNLLSPETETDYTDFKFHALSNAEENLSETQQVTWMVLACECRRLAIYQLSMKPKRQKSHLFSQNVEPSRRSSVLARGKSGVLPTDHLFHSACKKLVRVS